MAVDKLVDSSLLDASLADIADAIRTKGGTEALLTLAQMPQAIADLPSGGGTTVYEATFVPTSDTKTVTLSVPCLTDLLMLLQSDLGLVAGTTNRGRYGCVVKIYNHPTLGNFSAGTICAVNAGGSNDTWSSLLSRNNLTDNGDGTVTLNTNAYFFAGGIEYTAQFIDLSMLVDD